MLLKAAFGPGRAVGEKPACDRTPGTPEPPSRPPSAALPHSALMLLSPVAPPGGPAPPGGCGSPARVVFTVGSPPRGSSAPPSSRGRKSSGDSQGRWLASNEPVLSPVWPTSALIFQLLQVPSAPSARQAPLQGAPCRGVPLTPPLTLAAASLTLSPPSWGGACCSRLRSCPRRR